MFGFVRTLIDKISKKINHITCVQMEPVENDPGPTPGPNPEPDPGPDPGPNPEPEIETITMESIIALASRPSTREYEYEHETRVIDRWKVAARNDIVPLIAMIRQLYFFSDCRKSMLRTYALCKEDISSYVGKIKRHPELQIDVSDVDIHDHPKIFNLYRRLHAMIGMFRVHDFMVRVEHSFDNSQIMSEHFVVSQIMKRANDDPTAKVGGIDSVHHIVLPTCVQLNNLRKIPPKERTMFHHISYSIQPVVQHSQTLDAWFKTLIVLPTFAQIMRMCIQIAEALTYLHSSGIVHGDIKPGNTLIQTPGSPGLSSFGSSSSGSSSSGSSSGSPDSSDSDCESESLSLYLIDFGMSGGPGQSDGTGGTKPFCAPETGNGFNPKIDVDTYTWTKTQKHHDVWSFALMFFTLIVLRKSTAFPKDYPYDFFDIDTNGHINPAYFEKIQDEPMRDLFRRALCPAEERITAAEFLAAATGLDSMINRGIS